MLPGSGQTLSSCVGSTIRSFTWALAVALFGAGSNQQRAQETCAGIPSLSVVFKNAEDTLRKVHDVLGVALSETQPPQIPADLHQRRF